MKFITEIKQLFQCDSMSISERMNTVETSVPFNITIQELPKAAAIQSVCALVPARDTFTLTFKNDSDELLTVSNKQTTAVDFSAFIDGMASDDILEARIQIDKSIEANKFSIYDFNSFTRDLLRKPLTEVLMWFSNLLSNNDYLIFEVYDYDISLSTGTMGFVSNTNALFTPKVNRRQRLNACRETAYFYNMNVFEVIPDDFKIEGIEHSESCLKPLFGRLSTILSLAYMGSSSSILDNSLNIQINGQRTSTYTLKLDDIQENAKWLSIYSWIYTDGNPTDKSLIAHNIISLHCKYAALLDVDDKVFDSIKSNYKMYLRNNVGQYFEKRAARIDRIVYTLVQVNIACEETKFGIRQEQALKFFEQMTKYKNIRVKGLMTVAPKVELNEDVRPFFSGLRELFESIKNEYAGAKNISMEYLSMGMSNDYQIAIEEGANIIRVGTAIFGSRQYNIPNLNA